MTFSTQNGQCEQTLQKDMVSKFSIVIYLAIFIHSIMNLFRTYSIECSVWNNFENQQKYVYSFAHL